MSAIREKVQALLEGIESSAEIIADNVVDWDDRRLDREPGTFTADEISMLNKEREVELHMSSDEAPSCEVSHTKTVTIGVAESAFAAAVRKALTENDMEGPRKYNTDSRIAAWMVKDALMNAMGLESAGINVDAGNDNNTYYVSGLVDVELPKTLKVMVDNASGEEVELELEDSANDYRSVYTVKNA